MTTNRRTFVKATAASLACAALPALPAPQTFDPALEDRSGPTCYRQTAAQEAAGEDYECVPFEKLRKDDRARIIYDRFKFRAEGIVASDPEKTLIGKDGRWTWQCTMHNLKRRV